MVLWLAVWLQLADPNESELDAATLLCRLAALHDAPPWQDVERLPPGWVCDQHDRFAIHHGHWLESRWIMEPHLYAAWRDEHQRHWRYWSAADYARRAGRVVEVRASLRTCRDLVGRRAWDACEWPAAAPVWRFAVE